MLLWLVVVIFVLIAITAIKIHQIQKEYPIPGPPPLPILGNVLDVAKADSFMLLASEWLNKYGNVIQIFLLAKRMIIIGKHPEAIKDIYTNSAYIKGQARDNFRNLTGESGMVFADGELWSKARRSCTGAFHKDYLRLFEDPIRQCATVLVDELKKNVSNKGSLKTVDMDKYFVKATLDVLGLTMLSADFQSLTSNNAEIPRQVELWLDCTLGKITNPLHWLTTPTSTFVLKKASDYLKNFVEQLIAARIKLRNVSRAEHRDLLDLLIDAQDPESGAGLTSEEVRDQVLTFLTAGHETTAHTLSYAIASISSNPQVFAKIREELDHVIGKNTDVLPSYEQCTKLPYLGAVIKETLRMHPIAPAIVRELQEDRKVAGYALKAGDLVVVDLISMHYNAETWDKPDLFKPERFLQSDPDKLQTFQSYEYSPFGNGKRSCIGQHFAVLEMKILLSAMLRKFRFQHTPLHATTTKEAVTLRPKGGLLMTVWEE